MGAALVTGASAGLGVVFARRLAKAGYDLILVARRGDRLDAVATELRRDYGVQADPLVADLTADEGVAKVSASIDRLPRLDVLVNNAGFGVEGLFWQADPAGQDQMHRLHVMATMRLSHAALRKMVPQKSGAVINVSSVAAFSIGAGSVSYCSTKAWMNAFSEGLAAELEAVRSPVKVQALCPGFTKTEFHDVLGMDRGLVPGWMWLTAEKVVDESFRGLESGKVIVITGAQYKAFVGLLKMLPSPAIRWIRRQSGRQLKRVAAE
jgi:short-subunit dehydrogenase